ncbi:MAG: hypothetical protein IPK26_18410 [Planctomycetes bacterium]|nr:hypothetical protein [Planctomycetota bacterium]
MRNFLRSSAAVLLAAIIVVLATPPAPRLLHRRTDWYREDAAAARPIAVIVAELHGAADRVELTFTIDAEGPGVDPLPGLTSVAGANLRTAEELDRLFGDGALRVLTRRLGDRAQHPGQIAISRRGKLPAHRIDPRGALRLFEQTEAEYMLAVTATSGPLPVGEHETFVFVNELPRLRVVTVVEPGGGRIAAIESLGEHELFPRRP